MQKKLKAVFEKHTELDSKSVDFLVSALEKSNLPGFDYLEFKQSVAALQAMQLDEVTAMRSAFATASTIGLTKDKLIETATHYKGVLAAEKKQFGAALQHQMDQRVNGKMQEVEKLKKQIDDYKLKIKQLEEKIISSQAVIDRADEDVREAKSKIEAAGANFEQALRVIFGDIEEDIQQFRQYL